MSKDIFMGKVLSKLGCKKISLESDFFLERQRMEKK
jgi:hypothetical protein